MNDEPLPNVESVDDEGVDETIQRKWDRFAMPDEVVDLEEPDSPPVTTARGLTDEPIATEFDSPPADGSATTLGTASAKTASAGVADDTDITEPPGQWELREGFT